jgi:hypothetical protein
MSTEYSATVPVKKERKFRELEKRQFVREKQLRKDIDRRNREKSTHFGKKMGKSLRKQRFINETAEEDEDTPTPDELAIHESIQPKIVGRIKRKINHRTFMKGHRTVFYDRELILHRAYFNEAAIAEIQKCIEERVVGDCWFEIIGSLDPPKKVRRIKEYEENYEPARTLPYIPTSTDGDPIDYFSLSA